jgi:hypothetical protein
MTQTPDITPEAVDALTAKSNFHHQNRNSFTPYLAHQVIQFRLSGFNARATLAELKGEKDE